MFSNLEKTFEKIGARVTVVFTNGRRSGFRVEQQEAPALLNIINKKGEEIFEIAIRQDLAGRLDLSVLEVLPKERHLVLLSRLLDKNGNAMSKDHFLCGHDERHLFVATVESVSTVAAAKASLKPEEILNNETGLNTKKRNRRKTRAFKRQGEWFFIPAAISPKPNLIRREEPLIRGRGSKPHTAQFAFRTGGESVYVCQQYPDGLNQREYDELLKSSSKAKAYSWRHMLRNPEVYVRGGVKHADHATIVLDGWHRVLLNTERRSQSVGFLD